MKRRRTDGSGRIKRRYRHFMRAASWWVTVFGDPEGWAEPEARILLLEEVIRLIAKRQRRSEA